MKIQISEHFTTKKLFKFVIPSVMMMVFTSIYGVVDGFFVSNYAGKTQFAAVNLIMPFLMMLGVFGFMVGAGGNAIIAKNLGEGNRKKANEVFSMLIYFVIAVGIIITVVGQLVLEKVAFALGARDQMLEYCVEYGRIVLLSVTFFMLQNTFQNLLITADKPHIGLAVTVTAGVSNMLLDFIFVGVLKLGVTGAAAATAICETLGGLIPLLYFCFKNSSSLRLGKAVFDGKALAKTCTNGSSELMTNVSMSLVNMLYNLQLLKFYGEDGVAAYGVIMYVNFVFIATFIGYSIGVAPIVSYNYGSQNTNEMKNIFKKSCYIMGGLSLILTAASILVAPALAKFYVGYDEQLYNLTVVAFRLFATSYLVASFNIFGSAFFTALNNGLISATISFLRTLLFQIICVFVLPLIFGKNAIWLSITVAELLTFAVTVTLLVVQNKNYYYADFRVKKKKIK